MTKFIGEKYEATRNLEITEVAKLIRKDLRDAFPAYKFKLQVEKYAGGRSIHIQVSGTGLNRYDANDSEAVKALQQAVKQVGDAYNWDESDWQSDYHATNFYNHDIKIES